MREHAQAASEGLTRSFSRCRPSQSACSLRERGPRARARGSEAAQESTSASTSVPTPISPTHTALLPRPPPQCHHQALCTPPQVLARPPRKVTETLATSGSPPSSPRARVCSVLPSQRVPESKALSQRPRGTLSIMMCPVHRVGLWLHAIPFQNVLHSPSQLLPQLSSDSLPPSPPPLLFPPSLLVSAQLTRPGSESEVRVTRTEDLTSEVRVSRT